MKPLGFERFNVTSNYVSQTAIT